MFGQALSRLATLQRPERIRAWLFAIARNAEYNLLVRLFNLDPRFSWLLQWRPKYR